MAEFEKSEKLQKLSTIKHGFFTRSGGLSGGIYASLNCGTRSDDDADTVIKNRLIACNSLACGTALVEIHQTHSNVVHKYSGDFKVADADAIVTDRKNIALSVVTADCAPVLLADPIASVIGVAHVGWNGALGGIIENTVTAMCEIGATCENIQAAIGPCIAQKSYQVGPEFYENIADENYFQPSDKENHYLFDLESYISDRLWLCKITKIDPLKKDTYDEKNNFFSYRRKTHLRENDYGRQISIILQQ